MTRGELPFLDEAVWQTADFSKSQAAPLSNEDSYNCGVWLPDGERDGRVVLTGWGYSYGPLFGDFLRTLADCAQTPLGESLGKLGLRADRYQEGSTTTIVATFPSTETFLDRIEHVRKRYSDEVLTRFALFDGVRYEPEDCVDAHADQGVTLIANQPEPNYDPLLATGMVHDMLVHVPSHIARPPLAWPLLVERARSVRAGKVPYVNVHSFMDTLDLQWTPYRFGQGLAAGQSSQGLCLVREAYTKVLGVGRQEANSLTEATFRHVDLLGSLAVEWPEPPPPREIPYFM